MPRGPIDFDLLNRLEPDALFEVLRRQFETACRAGRAPSIESILAKLPSVCPHRLVTTLAEEEFRVRRELGDLPRVDEYLERFPQFKHDLASRLTVSLFPLSYPVGSTVNLADSAYGRKLAARANLRTTGIGRYRVDEQLGTGASGEVWKGYDTELLRPVAIKLLRADRSFGPDAEQDFLDEGRKLAQLKHPGIVAIYDVGKTDGNYFLVSEYVDDGTLDKSIKRSPPRVDETVRIIAEIAEALHYAHTHGFVHRDVKPQNILLAKDGTARLADFGLAATEEEQLFEEASIRGTLSFMSPEQLRGDSHLADARSDIYSLGAVFYLMLAGRLPFLAQSISQLREQALNREPRPLRTINDKLPPILEQICLKCLRLQPGDRYTTALDLARDLRAALAPQTEPKRRHWLRSLWSGEVRVRETLAQGSWSARSGDSRTDVVGLEDSHVVGTGSRDFSTAEEELTGPAGVTQPQEANALVRHRWWLAVPVVILGLAAIGWGVFENGKPLGGGGQKDPNEVPPPAVPPVKSPIGNVSQPSDQPLSEVTVAADGSAQFRTIGEALSAVAPQGTIRLLDQATYQENMTINNPVRHQGITIDGSSGATLTSMTATRPIIEVNGVDHVQLRHLQILISESEHAVMITGGAEGTRLQSLQITQPNSAATAALQIFGANSGERSAQLVITDCDIESHLTGQSLWIHAEPTPVHNLLVTRNRFRSRGKGTLVVMQGCLKNVVIEENKFEGGHIGLNVNASPTEGPAFDILSNTFHRCDNWIGLMTTKPASIDVALTNNLVLACPTVEINDEQLTDIQTHWTLGGNCWERDPGTVPAESALNALARFYPEIVVKSRKINEAGYLELVDPPPRFVPIKKDSKR